MPKRVLDVGQCDPDHAAIRGLIGRHFDAEVVRTHLPDDTLSALNACGYDLVLVNRHLDADYSEGLDILRRIKADPRLASTPVMLVTNYAEHQQAAVAAGAAYGFGKAELSLPATIERLRRFLG